MNEQEMKEWAKLPVEEMIAALPDLTEEEKAMFNEYGDLIPTPENPTGSITALRTLLHGSTSTTPTEKTKDG